ncbi:zinc finger and BTB domain-containing protein 43 [Chanos chanos]|uniref:Zinc finger and BTB domain-containing protein 43 n=1 Tax=Chanos chanos TaxID=29144 RepID=A0A6J2VZX4_CHACN|nr:zinc finger and BTB domain-containing protein 43 [Chanos chanos]
MASQGNAFHVEFPDFSCSILQKLNHQRQRGQLCDIIVVMGEQEFRAHRAVLAASSPYFCDQVLLKNSARVVLPDVMHPYVFERLLLSCYTGAVSVPTGEVVAFLTAASFLQLWHVVDKCTELLDKGTASRPPGHKAGSVSGRFEHGLSPRDGSYQGDGADGKEPGSSGADGSGRTGDSMEELLEEGVSPPAEERGAVAGGSCSSPAEQDGSFSEDGEMDAVEKKGLRPAYVQPSIMGRRRWMQVKVERQSHEDCDGAFTENPVTPVTPDCDPLGLSALVTDGAEGSLDREDAYENPLDFYGTSMEGFSEENAQGSPTGSGDSRLGGGAVGVARGRDDPEMSGGPHEDASQPGFASAVYKLYPCQCGKSFTHKSQRDRHMGMHLGLRPFGCAVCGKSFKMKHHLVGHMKIHTGVKPYECSVCSKRFMWRDSFNRHTSTCARPRPRPCPARSAATEQDAQIC